MKKRHLWNLIMVMLLFSILTIGSSFAIADEFGGKGPFKADLLVKEDGILSYEATGSGFSIFVMTQENYQRLIENQSFAYIDHLSVLNTTHVEVSGEISKGSYAFVIINNERSTTTFDFNVVYPNWFESNIEPYLELIIILILIILLIIESVFLIRFRNELKKGK